MKIENLNLPVVDLANLNGTKEEILEVLEGLHHAYSMAYNPKTSYDHNTYRGVLYICFAKKFLKNQVHTHRVFESLRTEIEKSMLTSFEEQDVSKVARDAFISSYGISAWILLNNIEELNGSVQNAIRKADKQYVDIDELLGGVLDEDDVATTKWMVKLRLEWITRMIAQLKG